MNEVSRCDFCKGIIAGAKKNQRFCSSECREASYKKYKTGHGKYQIGERKKNKDGYVLIYHPNHPNTDLTTGWVREHALIITQFLNRPLKSYERVHHKNGIRDDNRIENLELWTTSHPAGQRVSDMIIFCKWYLRRYEKEYQQFIIKKLFGEQAED